MRNPYELLAVPRSATAGGIKKSFRLLAKKLHPDANQNNPKAAALFAELKAAYEYEILGNEAKRGPFDRGDTFDRGGIDAEDNPMPMANPTWAISGLTLSLTALMLAVVILVAPPLVMRSPMPPMTISANTASELGPFGRTVVDRGSLHREPLQKPAITPGAESAGAMAVSQSVGDNALANSALTDRSAIQSAANSQRDHEPIEHLIGRTEKLISQGYVEAARMLLQPAAEAGDARAALALGATYDPVMLGILQVRGVAADVWLARYWYEKASELGSQEAEKRLQLLSVASVQPKGHVVRPPTHLQRPPSGHGLYVVGAEAADIDPLLLPPAFIQ
jgi:hypothetical protein